MYSAVHTHHLFAPPLNTSPPPHPKPPTHVCHSARDICKSNLRPKLRMNLNLPTNNSPKAGGKAQKAPPPRLARRFKPGGLKRHYGSKLSTNFAPPNAIGQPKGLRVLKERGREKPRLPHRRTDESQNTEDKPVPSSDSFLSQFGRSRIWGTRGDEHAGDAHELQEVPWDRHTAEVPVHHVHRQAQRVGPRGPARPTAPVFPPSHSPTRPLTHPFTGVLAAPYHSAPCSPCPPTEIVTTER